MYMREFTVFAPAKLNLYLDVLGKRPDGYHNIKTLFEKIDLKDEIVVREKGDKGIDIETRPAVCPSGEDNIVHKALQRLFKVSKVNIGLDILIRKKIPVGAGMAGGSSDAASALRSVNDRFELGMSKEALFKIAVETGKDAPFFMLDESFAIGRGAGDVLEPLLTETMFTHIIIKPDISISTSEMYRRLDGHRYLPKASDIGLVASAVKGRDIRLLEKSYYNAFEEVLFDYKLDVEKAKSLLLNSNAGVCFLSGSGPSVFCTTKNRGEAMGILDRIPKMEGMRVFLAETYKGGIYGDK